MAQVLSLLVENRAGVLASVVGLFSQRGYNIETLNVAPTHDPSLSVITLSTSTEATGTEQVVKQLNKLIDVIKVVPYDSSTQLLRDMALVRVRVRESNRAEILALSEVFNVRVVDANPRSYVFEITGKPDKIDGFLQNMRPYGIRDLHRTGCLAVTRGMVEPKKSPTPSTEGSGEVNPGDDWRVNPEL